MYEKTNSILEELLDGIIKDVITKDVIPEAVRDLLSKQYMSSFKERTIRSKIHFTDNFGVVKPAPLSLELPPTTYT